MASTYKVGGNRGVVVEVLEDELGLNLVNVNGRIAVC